MPLRRSDTVRSRTRARERTRRPIPGRGRRPHLSLELLLFSGLIAAMALQGCRADLIDLRGTEIAASPIDPLIGADEEREDPHEEEPEPADPVSTIGGGGIWIDRQRVASLPMAGPAWENVKEAAERPCSPFDLADQSNDNNTCVLARALVYARTGNPIHRDAVVDALASLALLDDYDGRALAMGRNLAAYVIAADLIDLRNLAPGLDELLRLRLEALRRVATPGAASDLVDCHERRPNNWGTHCGASRAAVAVYLGDSRDLARTAQVFRGFLGDRSSYSGFTFGGPHDDRDHSWECDPERPVGINPKGCTKAGRNFDGIIPDDQRRGGSFDPAEWPPPRENYVWEALQGILVQATILHRAGYDPFEWGDRAILRAVRWLHEELGYPAEGDDTWQPHVVNHYYGTSFPAPVPARHGKNVGWTDWTHR